MLVLTRRPSEEILIDACDPPIRIKVADVRGSRVRIAIECPKKWDVRRGELEQVEQQETSGSSGPPSRRHQ